MTKSYQDGIIDAIEIVSKWKYVGIQQGIVISILEGLNKLLSTAQEDTNSKHQISLFDDITNDNNKSREYPEFEF